MGIRRKWLWTVVTALIAAVTIWSLFYGAGISPAALIEVVGNAQPLFLIPALLGMLGFVFFLGEALLSIIHRVGHPRSHAQGFVYAAADLYFSAITPSATGGQPASAFFMIGDGIPAPVVTAALLLNLIMYNLAVLGNGMLCLILRWDVFLRFDTFCRILIILGFLTLMGTGTVFYLVLFHPTIPRALTSGLIRFLTRLRLMRKPEKWSAKMEKALFEYGECVKLMRSAKGIALHAFVLNVLQRCSQISVSLWVFLALGGSPSKLWDVWATQSLCVMGSNCVPIPGAMGVTEYIMLVGYQAMMEEQKAYQLEILSRGFSFYFLMIFCGVVTLAGYIIIRKLKRREGRNAS